MEYDNIYPPLNQAMGNGWDSEHPKKTALQNALDEARNSKKIIISIQDRRYKAIDDVFNQQLKELCERIGVEVHARISNLGSVIFDIIKFSDKYSEEQCKYIIRETFSKQVERHISLTGVQSSKISEKLLREKFGVNRIIKIRIDNHYNRIHISGGPNSVRLAESEIEDYLAWNGDNVTVDIPFKAPFKFYLCGNENSKLNRFAESSGKFVIAQYFNEGSNIIRLSGNRRCVDKCHELITQYYENLRKTLKICEYKLQISQDRIFRELGIFNELQDEGIPCAEHKTSDGLICVSVAGDQSVIDSFKKIMDKFLNKYHFFSIKCPYWCCLFFSLLPDFELNFSKQFGATFQVDKRRESINIVCDEAKTENIREFLGNIVSDIKAQAIHRSISINLYVLNLLNDNESLRLHQIEKANKVTIFIDFTPPKALTNNEILSSKACLLTIIGLPQAVDSAMEDIEELISYVDSYEKQIMVYSKHYFKYLFPVRSNRFKEIQDSCAKDCSIEITDSSEHSSCNIIKITGPGSQISAFENIIEKLIEEIDVEHHREDVVIPTPLIRIIIDDRRNIINKIKKIGKLDHYFIPNNTKGPTIIELIGPKTTVLECVKLIKKRFEELHVSVVRYFTITDKLRPFLVHFGNEISLYVAEQVGGYDTVKITIPSSFVSNDNIKVFGLEKHVDQALQILVEMSTPNSNLYFLDYVECSSKISYMITNIIFDFIKATNVRCYFYTPSEEDKHIILLIGNHKHVLDVKKAILKKIYVLENTVEKTITMKAEYKKEFLRKRGDEATLVQKLASQFEDTYINIGDRQNDTGLVNVRLVGLPKNVNSIINEISRLCEEFDKRIEKVIEFKIATLREIIEKTKHLLKNTMSAYNVTLSISENFYQESQYSENICKLSIRGAAENVQNCYNEINAFWKVVVVEMNYPQNLQQRLLSSHDYNIIRNNLKIVVTFGFCEKEPVEKITVTGFKANVDDAVRFIDRLLSENFEISVPVPSKYYNKLIGKNGVTIQQFNRDFNVKVSIPSRTSPGDVKIIGSQTDCLLAKKELERLVEEWDSLVTVDVYFDSKIKAKLTGTNNAELNKIGKETNTRVTLVYSEDRNAVKRIIRISGQKPNVDVCQQRIQKEIDTLMDGVEESYFYDPSRNKERYVVDEGLITSMKFVTVNKTIKKKQKNEPLEKDESSSPPLIEQHQK